MAIDVQKLLADMKQNSAYALGKATDAEIDREVKQRVKQDNILDKIAMLRGSKGIDVGGVEIPGLILGVSNYFGSGGISD